jgi:hypothetical protein
MMRLAAASQEAAAGRTNSRRLLNHTEDNTMKLSFELYYERTKDGGTLSRAEGTVRIEGVTGMYATYQSLLRVQFESAEAKEAAQALTGWEEWDSDMLAVGFEGGMVKCGERYFADWSLTVEQADEDGQNLHLISAAPELLDVVVELEDLCPRISDDDPIAPAIRDSLVRARAAIAKANGEDKHE